MESEPNRRDRSRQVRAVLFDAVGTLIYPDPPVAEVYHLAGWSHGSQLAPEEIERRFHAAFRRHTTAGPEGDASGLARLPTSESQERERWRQIVADVFDDLPAAQEGLFEMLWTHFAQPEHWRLYGDVPGVWQTLEERGYVVGIASNFDGRLRALLRGHPPLTRCQALFVSSQIGHPKPAPEFFAGVEPLLQLPGQQILLVGDDELNDVQGARAAGWHAVRLQRGAFREEEDTIQTLADLLDLLPTIGV